MRLNKKGIELSLQTVVVGIILLIVMGVVIFMFANGANKQGAIIDDNINNAQDPSFIDNLLKCKEGDTQKRTTSDGVSQVKRCSGGEWSSWSNS